ncbi:MAG TPA: LemA family protein [Gemmatimonadales bacterium]|nr:LemA family protein [Gemmatimonadales bacterium]
MTIVVIAIALVLVFGIFTWNKLTRLRQLADNAWADIDVQLKRRHDLIPQVVAVVKGHADYEKGTLESVVQARSSAMSATSPASKAAAEEPVARGLSRIFALSEAYPELRAMESFRGLQTTLADIEDHLQNARRYYNAVVRDFNTAIQQFPANLIAGTMGFGQREFFGLDDRSEAATPGIKLAIFLAVLATASPASAQDRTLEIQNFSSLIRVNQDATLDIQESIAVQFNGKWNGIYRTVPVEYRTPQGFNWSIQLDLLGATDGSGEALKVETRRERHYIKYKIWIPGAENTGKVVSLRYRVRNGLRFFEDHDELYWNATGDEWDVPLGLVTTQVELPAGATGIRTSAFTGAVGSTANDAIIDTSGTTVSFALQRGLGYREGLTVVIGWNKGVVTEPTKADKAVGFFRSNWPLLIPLPVFLLAFMIWQRRGKDPEGRPVMVQYDPPEHLSPAEAGTLIDNAADMRDITATMVDLAVRGFIRIEEREDSKLFGLIKNQDFYLHRLKDGMEEAKLAVHERRVLEGIFESRGSVVSLDDLKNEFYTELPGIRDGIFTQLLTHGYYRSRPDKVAAAWAGGALAIGVLIGFGGSFISASLSMTPVPFIVAGVLSTIILMSFAAIMPARTEAGARALEKVKGFEEFLRRVESPQFAHVQKTPELFDRCLPYAMAFGVEQKWAKAFEGIYREPPNWYAGGSMTRFSAMNFSSQLSSFTTSAGSTMSSSPRSSSGSGFSGGSSGGGGGGGGGGGF